MAHEHSCDRIADEFTSRMLECRREPARVNVAELGSRHLVFRHGYNRRAPRGNIL